MCVEGVGTERDPDLDRKPPGPGPRWRWSSHPSLPSILPGSDQHLCSCIFLGADGSDFLSHFQASLWKPSFLACALEYFTGHSGHSAFCCSRPPRTASLGALLSPCAQRTQGCSRSSLKASFHQCPLPQGLEKQLSAWCLLPGAPGAGESRRSQETHLWAREECPVLTALQRGRLEERAPGSQGGLLWGGDFQDSGRRSQLCKVWKAAFQREGGWSRASGSRVCEKEKG